MGHHGASNGTNDDKDVRVINRLIIQFYTFKIKSLGCQFGQVRVFVN